MAPWGQGLARVWSLALSSAKHTIQITGDLPNFKSSFSLPATSLPYRMNVYFLKYPIDTLFPRFCKCKFLHLEWASFIAQQVKDLPAVQEIKETRVRSLGCYSPYHPSSSVTGSMTFSPHLTEPGLHLLRKRPSWLFISASVPLLLWDAELVCHDSYRCSRCVSKFVSLPIGAELFESWNLFPFQSFSV